MDHQWKRTHRGQVDDFAYDVDIHAGPRCTVCDFFFCVNCYARGWQYACPGPAPEGREWDWIGDGAGHPPETPELWPVD